MQMVQPDSQAGVTPRFPSKVVIALVKIYPLDGVRVQSQSGTLSK